MTFPKPEPVLHHPRAQYSSRLQARRPRGYTLLSPSLHSQCVVVGSRRRAIGVGASRSMWLVASLDQKASNEWSLFFRRQQMHWDSNPSTSVPSVFSIPFPSVTIVGTLTQCHDHRARNIPLLVNENIPAKYIIIEREV